jgi:hypothetical protein
VVVLAQLVMAVAVEQVDLELIFLNPQLVELLFLQQIILLL